MSTKLERVLGILGDINRGGYPTVADLCSKYEVAERTIHEDIRFIKDRTRTDIRFDKRRLGYYNANPDKKLPEFDLTEEELLALALSKEMLEENTGPIFRVFLDSALNKIKARSRDGETPFEFIEDFVRFVPGGVATAERKVLLDMRKACADKHSVEIDYYTAHTGQSSTRIIDPYEIVEHKGAWYAVAWCHKRKEVRKFALHRIRKHQILKETFSLIVGFDIDSYMTSAFMLEHGDGLHQVRIKFTPVGARYAMERRWHPEQKVTTHKDGSCTLEFPTQSFDEVKRWVLPFGSGAEVIDPPELRRRVLDELERTLKGYLTSGS